MASWNREPLEDFEADELRQASQELSSEHELTIRTLLHTGMRAAEFAHMTSDWVDWKEKAISVQPADDWEPKSAAGERLIPVRSPDVERVLNRHFAEHPAIPMSRTTIWRPVT